MDESRVIIQRDPKYYTAGHSGNNPSEAPFYLRALVFDGKDGDFNTNLVNEFNNYLGEKNLFPNKHLIADKLTLDKIPAKIIIINASHDKLPTSYETALVFEEFCKEKGVSIPAKVVNSREDLMREIEESPDNVLVMSQCVDKNVYNIKLAEELIKRNVVIVPGKVTAPGSVFSDKDSTYQLLSDNGEDWSEVARYRKISAEDKSIEDVVNGIFSAIDELETEIGDAGFFIKPHEGGGGLGGFRVTKHNDGYIIPDLSKVTGDETVIHPTFIDFDITNEAKLRELLWIYRLFSEDEKMAANYLKVKLPLHDKSGKEAIDILRDYLSNTEEKRHKRLAGMVVDRNEAYKRLVEAIGIFEKKFNRRYIPLVNEHIDFGLWGLRAHYRLSRRGPELETMYHRVFQLSFTEEGLGYVGADNISNKQTGELEIKRLGPLNSTMVASIGGKEELFKTLLKGAVALVDLAKLVPEEENNRIPLRLQIDLAAVSQRIGEGNADTARGLCLASRWSEFVRNAREWLEDSLVYYAWKKESRSKK